MGDSDVAMLMTDPRGDVVACNGRAAALFELAPDRIVGRSIARLIPGSEILISTFRDRTEPVRLVALRAQSGEFSIELAVERSAADHSRFVAVIREA